ncbi:MAG: hypothetical protein FD130_2032 [Halothiobacillaceae bacterium]|nr:MAG: hypothetical protein FD130_2032 [Halothiobacillaceae bacterium]
MDRTTTHHRSLLTVSMTALLLLTSHDTLAKEFKCYVTASDTLHYLVIVDFESAGMASLAARHVWINTKETGKVGIQDVHECVALDASFRSNAAKQLDANTPRSEITNARK